MSEPRSTVELPCRDWRDRGSPRPLSSLTFEIIAFQIFAFEIIAFQILQLERGNYLLLLGHGEEDEGKLDNVGDDLGL